MEELTQEMELEMDKYIKKLEEDLELTIINKPESKLLLELFRDTEEKSKPSEKYFQILLNEFSERKKELLETFTDEQRLLFEKYNCSFQELEEQRTEQFFVYGFCMGNKLNEEVNNILNNN